MVSSIFSGLIQQQQMQSAAMMQQLFGGGLHGQHWQPGSALYGNPYSPIDPRYLGALYSLAAYSPTTAAPTPKPIEDAGIRAGEIRAWRCWRLHHGFLRSATAQAVWAPGEVMTGDVSVAGVHAWKTQSKALEYGLEGNSPIIFGEVDLWGEVVEHEDGYRAEFAAIVTLSHCTGFLGAWRLRKLRQRYLAS